jgi:hypothetical protein
MGFQKKGNVTEKTSEPNQFASDNTTIGTNFGTNNHVLTKNSN